jgi:hypothetical protein
VQQLREAFPEAAPYRYVILDRDSKFDEEVITFLKATGLEPRRTSIRALWQNGLAERWEHSVYGIIVRRIFSVSGLIRAGFEATGA